MRSDLIYTYTSNMSPDDWLLFRDRGLGASDMGTVMNYNYYKSSVELFYEKIGERKVWTEENLAMFFGKEKEDLVAKYWEYWEGSPESMVQNFRKGRRIRKMRKVNAYIQNPDFMHIFVSLDRIINKLKNKGEGALELKTINSWASKKWDIGIPPQYLLQVLTQMLVCDLEYGEIAILEDGYKYDVIEIPKRDGVMNNILETSTLFWNAVKEARKLKTMQFEARNNFNFRLDSELQNEIDRLCPEPTGSEDLSVFLNEKYIDRNIGGMEGSLLHLEKAREHKKISSKIKTLEDSKRQFENFLKMEMKDRNMIDFGLNGKVLWKADINGTRRFMNMVEG